MYVIMALIVTTAGVSVIFYFVICKPVAKWWNRTIKGTCLPLETQLGLMYYQGGKTWKNTHFPINLTDEYLSKVFPSLLTFYWPFCPRTS